ncbi:hypothetical protein [Candidatus Vidania fulgoroideorum]
MKNFINSQFKVIDNYYINTNYFLNFTLNNFKNNDFLYLKKFYYRKIFFKVVKKKSLYYFLKSKKIFFKLGNGLNICCFSNNLFLIAKLFNKFFKKKINFFLNKKINLSSNDLSKLSNFNKKNDILKFFILSLRFPINLLINKLKSIYEIKKNS